MSDIIKLNNNGAPYIDLSSCTFMDSGHKVKLKTILENTFKEIGNELNLSLSNVHFENKYNLFWNLLELSWINLFGSCFKKVSEKSTVFQEYGVYKHHQVGGKVGQADMLVFIPDDDSVVQIVIEAKYERIDQNSIDDIPNANKQLNDYVKDLINNKDFKVNTFKPYKLILSFKWFHSTDISVLNNLINTLTSSSHAQAMGKAQVRCLFHFDENIVTADQAIAVYVIGEFIN